MKPVELMERAITNSGRRGATLLDVFGGSRTTLIACKKTERKGRHLDPRPEQHHMPQNPMAVGTAPDQPAFVP